VEEYPTAMGSSMGKFLKNNVESKKKKTKEQNRD
jgi:hypothetical protein